MKEIAQGIRYIGVDDKDLDLFESQYVVPEGMAYNSFVILDQKVAIMDTADRRKGEDWGEFWCPDRGKTAVWARKWGFRCPKIIAQRFGASGEYLCGK